MAKTNVKGRRLTEVKEGAKWWDGLTEEQRRDEINRRFELRWDENHCCPHFVIVDCVAGSPHKHVRFGRSAEKRPANKRKEAKNGQEAQS